MHATERYVIRTVRLDTIDVTAAHDMPAAPDTHVRKAALRFDGPIAAAAVLLAPTDDAGRYRVLAGREDLIRAHAQGHGVVLAAVARPETADHALQRWQVHHAA